MQIIKAYLNMCSASWVPVPPGFDKCAQMGASNLQPCLTSCEKKDCNSSCDNMFGGPKVTTGCSGVKWFLQLMKPKFKIIMIPVSIILHNFIKKQYKKC
jgi:hypothetical protein